MKPFVDIIGSGQNNTVINYTGVGGFSFDVVGNTALENLQISNGTGLIAICPGTTGSCTGPDENGKVAIRNVTISGGGTGVADGYAFIPIEIKNTSIHTTDQNQTTLALGGNASTVVENCSLLSDLGPAVVFHNGNGIIPVIKNSKLTGVYGILISQEVGSGSFEVINSTISGTQLGINNSNNWGVSFFKAAGSQIIGGFTGSAKIINCYDQNFNPIPNQ